MNTSANPHPEQQLTESAPTVPDPSRFPLFVRVALVAGAFVIGAAGCSKADDDESADTTNAPTTTQDVASSSTTEDTEPPDEGDEDDEEDLWAMNATAYGDDIGDEVDFECSADGDPRAIWGANIYTTDSSVCTAAVHVGLIDLEEGGEVTILISEGLDEYARLESNGIESRDYGSYSSSFSFPEADLLEVGGIPWDRTGGFYASRAGEEITVTCDGGGETRTIWGTDTYTSDSSICTAAVHAGLISEAEGGEVTLVVGPGIDSYEASTANGIESGSYGPWEQAFTFVGEG